MSALDWPGMIRAGLVGLRLRPREFWALTPVELQMMLGLSQGNAPLGRDAFAALQAAFPDEEMKDG